MERLMRISRIAHMVTPGGVAADVGTDHGYLAIMLIQEGIAERVIAMDVAEGPLSSARENIRKAMLTDRIETRLSNGLEKLEQGEADTVVMAGMGGNLIIRLLYEGRRQLETVRELVLSPQSELMQVRIFLMKNSYIIKEEQMLAEDGKNYVIMRVEHGVMQYDRRCELKYGRLLLEKQDKLLYGQLVKEKGILLKIKEDLLQKQSESVKKRLLEIDEDLSCIEDGLEYYDM